MNIGLYQSASALSALERWQDSVSQNITSSQTAGYRKRTISFSTQAAGELMSDPRARIGHQGSMPTLFPKINSGINFVAGETQPTRRELDASIQGDGFFEIQRPDGSKVYTRSGEFRMRPDRTLVTSSGDEVMSDAGAPIILLPGGGKVAINQDGTLFQGTTALGKLSVQKFADNSRLIPIAGGFFTAPDNMKPETVDEPELLQGYLEGSNVTPLREMVDLVLISRAYEANQKIISTVDDQMQKTLDALG
jgi:flagellar basal-body rod protein FlgF